jgi:hypothetical protein
MPSRVIFPMLRIGFGWVSALMVHLLSVSMDLGQASADSTSRALAVSGHFTPTMPAISKAVLQSVTIIEAGR